MIQKHQEEVIITNADDTNLLITQKLYPELVLYTDQNWFASNKILLNKNKTNIFLLQIQSDQDIPTNVTLLESRFKDKG